MQPFRRGYRTALLLVVAGPTELEATPGLLVQILFLTLLLLPAEAVVADL
jgi:hypothetical protein